MISFDIINNKKINEIKKAHDENIISIRNYFDNTSKNDLIMSLSALDNNIKIWNSYNFICLLNIKKVNKGGTLLSACFLNENNEIYILTSNRNFNTNIEYIKAYDLNGNKIKEINNSNNNTFFIDNYFDKKMSNNYIITGNEGYSISYDYNNNQIYHKYNDLNRFYSFSRSLIVNDNDEIIKLIEANDDGIIKIWNFHSGNLIKKIKICDDYICGLCLWNKDYILVGCYNKIIKLIDLNKDILNTKDLISHSHSVITVKKFFHPKYGNCILSQGLGKEQIKLWGLKE